MFAIFGLGPSEMLVLLVIAVVVLALLPTRRGGRTTPPPRVGVDDPLRRIKRDHETLTERERHQLLQFVQDDLRGMRQPDAPESPPPAPRESYRP
jgi:hypothetical protein